MSFSANTVRTKAGAELAEFRLFYLLASLDEWLLVERLILIGGINQLARPQQVSDLFRPKNWYPTKLSRDKMTTEALHSEVIAQSPLDARRSGA